ncbi:MAG: hypothetical protein R2765_03985 [Ferruginibacter sp.]|nr:hypothetical protein [Bacteroidota bacterium]MBX2918740.1 hypothetical protein [Ferruginibacter sp.]MCB0710037.1 hypothetical protein [Chitinophagaceae bacterium]MCC7379627.1 hypothetical protein [Chitinophagaceae bacterium]
MKYTVILFSFLLFSVFASAQIERKPAITKADSASTTSSSGKMNKQSKKDRIKDLDLTKEQKMKMREIKQSGKATKESIENNTSLSEEEKKQQLRALQIEQAQKIQEILTDEQKAKFKAGRQNRQ